MTDSKSDMDSEDRGIERHLRLQILLTKHGEPVLQKLFLRRYEIVANENWEDASVKSKLSFVSKHGILNSLNPTQEAILQTVDICQWDVTLFATLLLNSNCNPESSPGKQRLKEENDNIKKLRDLRNKLTHTSLQSMSSEEFSSQWSQAEDILTCFGVRKEDIDHIRTTAKLDGIVFHSPCVNESNTTKSKSLRVEGNAAIASGSFRKAVELYSRAILLLGLTNEERGNLCSNRSQAFLKILETASLSEDEKHEMAAMAMQDAKMAMNCRPSWWKSYCRAAQVNMYTKNFDEAIRLFNYALRLKPDQEDIRNRRDECKFENLRIYSREHLNPNNIRSRSEGHKYLYETRGFESNKTADMENEVRIWKSLTNSTIPKLMSPACLFMAQQYSYGDYVPYDMKMAASLFRKAADVGNPAASYSLGLLYMYGDGINRDVSMAVKRFEEAAYPSIPNPNKLDRWNQIGIRVGKYLVGKCYEEGIGYQRNYTQAFKLYLESSLEGCGDASSSLGNFYFNGLGVERNTIRAIQYAKLAVEQRNSHNLLIQQLLNMEVTLYVVEFYFASYLMLIFVVFIPAMCHLSQMLLELGDVDQAEVWFGRFTASSCTIAVTDKKSFELAVTKRRRELQELRKPFPKTVHPTTEVMEAYERFLEKVPNDHPDIPETCYTIAFLYRLTDNIHKMEEYYQRGLDAEKRLLLPSPLPYEDSVKRRVEALRSSYLRKEETKDPNLGLNFTEEDIQENEEYRKLQSTNPKRITLIREHRHQHLEDYKLIQLKSSPNHVIIFEQTTQKGLQTQRAPKKKDRSSLKNITFDQMDPTKDHVYTHCTINLTIMEDSFYDYFPSVHSVVKDDNGDFQRICIYNLDHNDPKVRNRLSFGTQLRVQNPYLRLPVDLGVTLRVDDPNSIIYVSEGDEKSICRFCWKENSKFHCSNCKRANYCSKECQVQDWKLLKHSLICRLSQTS